MNIVITGANKGLGLSLVKVFAGYGHQVAAGAHDGGNTKLLDDLAASSAGKVIVVPMDVANEASVLNAARKINAVYGNVDVLISNAGVLLPGDRTATIENTNIEELRYSFEVNTIGTVIVMKHFLPLMRSDGEGMMIFVTSEAGSVTNSGAGYPAYSVSKTAANKAVFILRATVGDKYRIYALHPGRMNTDMGRTTAQIEPEEAAEGIYRIATGVTKVEDDEWGFIDYRGKKMEI